MTNIPEAELLLRTQLAYVDKTPLQESHCGNCNLYIPSKNLPCGGCTLFAGPVETQGYCTYWAPIVEAN